jgi:hypothetical protein
MNYNQLLKKLPKTPAQSLYDSDGKEPTEEVTARLLFDRVYCVFEPPEEILSDQGSVVIGSGIKRIY